MTHESEYVPPKIGRPRNKYEAKTGRLNLKITETLKSRYTEALGKAGISISDHITNEIVKFIRDVERNEKKKENPPQQ